MFTRWNLNLLSSNSDPSGLSAGCVSNFELTLTKMSGVPNAASNLVIWGHLDVIRTAPFKKSITASKLKVFSRAFNLCHQLGTKLHAIIKICFIGLLHIELSCRDTPWMAEKIGTIIWRLYCCASLQQFQTHFTSARTDCRKSVKIIGFHIFSYNLWAFSRLLASTFDRLERNCVPNSNLICPPAENRSVVNKLKASSK